MGAEPKEGLSASRRLVEGAVLSKLSARNQRWQQRFVALVPGSPTATLRWSADVHTRKIGRRATILSLGDVLRVDLGVGRFPTALDPPQSVWCCFVLWSTSRSFIFLAPEETTAEAFAVGLSWLCP